MAKAKSKPAPAANQLSELETLIREAYQAYLQKDVAKGLELCRQAIDQYPRRADLWTLRGILLRQGGRLDEAVESYRKAIQIQPDFPDVYNNLGNILRDQGRFEAAEENYRRALALRPDFHEACNNLGGTLQALGRPRESLEAVREAIRLKPDYADAHWDHAIALLSLGDFEQGLPEYEWRFRRNLPPPREYAAPVWQGEPLAGKTLFLYGEQGFGDILQYLRFVPQVAAMGARVVLEARLHLWGLMKNQPGAAEVVLEGHPVPPFDFHLSLLSLPWMLKTTLETLSRQVPYLFPDRELVASWGQRLPREGLRVGLVWAGNPNVERDHWRSPRLQPLLPLLSVPNVTFVVLQKGDGRKDLEGLQLPPHFLDPGEAIRDFADSAAIMHHLDLVITSDTAAAHLAGALGRPVWVLLHFAPDWRWMFDRSDSPWYPDMRLFRQIAPGHWQDLVREVRWELAALAARHQKRNACHPGCPVFSTPAPIPVLPADARMNAIPRTPDEWERLQNLDKRLQAALKALNARDLTFAHSQCAEALRLAPELATVWTLQGMIFRAEGRAAEAVSAYHQAIELDPGFADAHRNLGNILWAMGRLEEAESSFLTALRFKPEDPDLLKSLEDVRVQRRGRSPSG